MGCIRPQEHRRLVEDLLEQHDLAHCGVEYVDSIQNWCQRQGIDEQSPFRTAKALRSDSGCLILLASSITPDMVASVRSGMMLRGMLERTRKLKGGVRFLTHLVLHEIAHLKGHASEADADRWAFDRMGIE